MPRPCLVVNTVLLLCVTSTGWAQDPDTTIRKVIVTRRSLETVTQKATGFTFVGSDTLVRACTLAHSKGYDTLKTTRSPAHILAAFCALGAPSVDANSMKAWNVATVPPADDIIRVAENDSLLTSDVQVVVQVDTVVLSSPLLLTNSNLFTGFGGSLGSFESTAIVGTTNWVVGRAKEEVSVYVVNQFARNLCSAALGRKISRPGAEDLVIRDSLLSYFPNTCQLLSRGSPAMLLGSGYGLPSWSVVQVKLRADLDVLPDTVFSRLRNVGAEAFTGSFNDPKAAAPIQRTLAAIGIGRLSVSYIKKHEMPIAFSDATNDMLASAYAMCGAGPCGTGLGGMSSLKRMVLVGATLGSASAAEFKTAGSDTAKLTAAALHAFKALLVNGCSSQQERLPVLAEAMHEYLGGFQANAKDELKCSTGPARVLLPATTWRRMSSTLIATVVFADSISKLKGDSTGPVKNYAHALPELASQLLSALDTSDAPQQVGQLVALAAGISTIAELRVNGKYSELVSELLTLVPSIAVSDFGDRLQSVTLPIPAARTLQFALDATQARDPTTFAGVLSSYAAAPSTFLKKREARPYSSCCYWSLNAYVGAVSGKEQAYGPGLPAASQHLDKYGGLTIPIGLEFGRPAGWIGGVGVLFQLVDVGQVATWRSHQDSSTVKDTPPGLTLSGIFSPGVAALWHIRRIPVSVGYAFTKAPQFRDLTSVSDQTAPKASVKRQAIFVGIDVPILP